MSRVLGYKGVLAEAALEKGRGTADQDGELKHLAAGTLVAV